MVCAISKCVKIEQDKKFYRLLTIFDAKRVETWKMDDFRQKLTNAVRIMSYRPAISLQIAANLVRISCYIITS